MKFLVTRDNDGADCIALKARLIELIPLPFRQRVRVRLVMQELESWYLGDLSSVAAAGLVDPGKAEKLDRKRIYRDPDLLNNAAQQFMKVAGKRGKIEAAKKIGAVLRLQNNRSASFNHFLSSLHWVAN